MSEGGKQAFAALRGIFFAAVFITLWSAAAAAVRRYDSLIGIEPAAWIRPGGWVLSHSLVAWTTVGLLWIGAVFLLFRMRARPELERAVTETRWSASI